MAISVERVEDAAGFADLRGEWDELLAVSPANCLFLTWEWLHTWWKHLAAHRRLHLLLVRDGRQLAAIAPLARRPPTFHRLLPLPALELLGTGIVGSDYLDVIVRPGSAGQAGEALADALREAPAVLEFAQTRRESSFARELTRRLGQQGWKIQETAITRCPFVDLTGHSWDSYLASLGPAHFQKRLRSLERRFDVRLDLVQTEEERREALGTLVEMHTRRWEERGGSGVFASPDLRAFYDEVTQLALTRGWLRLFVLRLDGAPAAVLHGYRYGPTFYFYQLGFEPTLAKESVGFLIIGLTIRRAIEEGAAEYDLLHGAEPYKFRFAHDVRELSRLELFGPGPRGAIYRGVAALSSGIRRGARRLVGDAPVERVASRGRIDLREVLDLARSWRHRNGVAARAK